MLVRASSGSGGGGSGSGEVNILASGESKTHNITDGAVSITASGVCIYCSTFSGGVETNKTISGAYVTKTYSGGVLDIVQYYGECVEIVACT